MRALFVLGLSHRNKALFMQNLGSGGRLIAGPKGLQPGDAVPQMWAPPAVREEGAHPGPSALSLSCGIRARCQLIPGEAGTVQVTGATGEQKV